ncbi:hypothetical protein AB3S75_010845 [Citrus x aurantiifolia]
MLTSIANYLGGVTIRHQCARKKGLELEDKMPPLHVAPSNMENKNTPGYLDEIRAELLHNI